MKPKRFATVERTAPNEEQGSIKLQLERNEQAVQALNGVITRRYIGGGKFWEVLGDAETDMWDCLVLQSPSRLTKNSAMWGVATGLFIKHGKEVYIGALPWYHSYGLTLTMLAGVHQAASIVCIPDPRAGKPPLSDLLGAIQKHKGTLLHAVPSLYAGIAYHPNISKYDLNSLKACGSGAAPLAPATAEAFEKATGATLFEGYGLTETSPLATADPSNKRQRKFGSVGFPMPDTLVKILDVETGRKELKVTEEMLALYLKEDSNPIPKRIIDGLNKLLE